MQSLKNLDDPNAFPMVAIRTSGLALSSLVGFMNADSSDSETVQSMVDEMHLRMLLKLGNARFEGESLWTTTGSRFFMGGFKIETRTEESRRLKRKGKSTEAEERWDQGPRFVALKREPWSEDRHLFLPGF